MDRRGFLASAGAVFAGLVGLLRPGRPPNPHKPHKTTTTGAATTTTQPATTTTGTTLPTTTSTTIGTGPARPIPGAEPFPASNYPPGTTVTLSGAQTSQYRPNALSDRILDLTGATWATAPTSLTYPIIIDDGGANVPNGHNTVLKGARINGNLDLDQYRGDNYDLYHSGIEHNCDSATGYIVADGIRVDNMMDGYRFKGDGTGYLKRSWLSNISDDGIEFEELTGDCYIYDCLFEGCCTGFSDRGGTPPPLSTSKIEVDGVLLWLKGQKDIINSSVEFQGCSGTAGCQELADSGKFTFAIWKGEPTSRPTVVVRNSWFRVDRLSCYGATAMAWPGTAGDDWGINYTTSYTFTNCKLLWTGLDLAGQPTSAAYPGPTLPAGVELVSGASALTMWNAAAASWKTAHGY